MILSLTKWIYIWSIIQDMGSDSNRIKYYSLFNLKNDFVLEFFFIILEAFRLPD